MLLKSSNINKLKWSSSILELSPRKNHPPQNLIKLHAGGIETLKDLVWLFPLRISPRPKMAPFSEMRVKEIFLGRGTVISIKFTPSHGAKGRGKGQLQLFNATCVLQDTLSKQYISLKWFNAYPGLKKQVEAESELTFIGTVSDYKGSLQIVSPKLNTKETQTQDSMLIDYPTVNSVSGKHIKKAIDKIPLSLWDVDGFNLNYKELELNLTPLQEALKTLHGKIVSSPDELVKARERVIYDEFFSNQLKVLARKMKNKALKADSFSISNSKLHEFKNLFPYKLTKDQDKVMNHIINDLGSSKPMMRMIQGDVGCGKTSIAILCALIITDASAQVALMCPTEALATQHAQTFYSLLGNRVNISLLLGNTKAKDKKNIYRALQNNETSLVIGTHALIQDSITFSRLKLVIIDEQHKFGVNQRQKLIKKGENVHTLIMTATPIPRTLQLSQYGDLDISTIRTMPSGRKGIKTRIVTSATYEKYLSFLKTRLFMGEQVYVVVPAIEESESLDLKNINSLTKVYRDFFPEFKIANLHGQLKPLEKHAVMKEFTNGMVDLLISTTVIEVGINIINSTVISIYNPDRFGLSSLHQLRGRVGRGEKAAFCFLIASDNISNEAMNRIKTIEKTTDGFEIAEADLANRGQGDLFGPHQSGHISPYKLANIIEHFSIFERVAQDIENLKENNSESINNLILNLLDNPQVSSTI